MHQAPHPKNTPARRRQNRNGTPHKNYASENDIPSQFHSGPSTPQKSFDSSHDSSTQGASTTSKHRGPRNNKQRNNRNNGNASPGFPKQGRPSPPLTAPAAKPVEAPAFAGSTFHASPAPSALPIPSFFSKSVPDSPAFNGMSNPSQEPSPPTSESDSPTPPASVPAQPREESPLDFFFNAQRAEKARNRRASSANVAAVAPGPFSPPVQQSPKDCNTFPRAQNATEPRRPQGLMRNQSSGISSTELDGTPGRPVGPAFSTPYAERIKAARSNSSSAQATPASQRPQEHDVDRTEALKRFLFKGSFSAPMEQQSQPAPQPAPQQRLQQLKQSGSGSGAPGQVPFHAHPQGHHLNCQPSPQHQQQFSPPPNDNFSAIEDSLRRVLKLDSAV